MTTISSAYPTGPGLVFHRILAKAAIAKTNERHSAAKAVLLSIRVFAPLLMDEPTMPHSEEWLLGEVPLAEMLDDPIVRLLMESDGLDKEAVQSALLAASTRKSGDLASTAKPH